MATREENLKTINDELELLSDEELEQVAGGNGSDTAYDSRFLYERGLIDDWHGETHTFFHWVSDSAAVDAGWSKAGITCVTKPFNDNKYFMGGKEISRGDAWKLVSEKYPKIRDCD